MKKNMLGLLILILSIVILGCDGCGDSEITEDYPLLLSSQELDGVFNPFYSTTGPDSSIVSMTQIGMLGNDKDGKIVYGEEEGVAVLDYEIDYDSDEDISTYYFVLKNNIKFSNGSPLTMKDVLFNLYEYLDPYYGGSSTIYSTDIIGLYEYRNQEPKPEEGAGSDSYKERFEILADARIQNLTDAADEIFLEEDRDLEIEEFKDLLEEYTTRKGYENVVKDFDKLAELFSEELEKDFNYGKGTAKDIVFYDKNDIAYRNLLSTDVEVFLYTEGYLSWNAEDAQLESSLTSNVAELKSWSKEDAINTVYQDLLPMEIYQIARYWAYTSVELMNYLTGIIMEEHNQSTEMTYKNISGIKFANMNESVTVNGVEYKKPIYKADGSVEEGNEVLSIAINGVDPKAIWNFSFIVAPMYYYSSSEQIALFDYEEHFGVEWGSITFQEKVIKDPKKLGVPVGAGPYKATDAAHSTGDIVAGKFHENNAIYFARNEYYLLGAPATKYIHYQVIPSNNLENALYNGEVDFIQPNSDPRTIEALNGKKDQGIENISIKTAGYGYVGVNAGKVPSINVRRAIMHSINTQEIVQFYEGTADEIHRPMSTTSWAYPKGVEAYYPYIGGKIPTNLDNVNPDYAAFVEEKGKSAGDTFTKAEQEEFIRLLVEDAGYIIGGDGTYVTTNGKSKLRYTFTIAGSDTDHPAFNAFLAAANFLNDINFDINVQPDAQALSKLATGDLAVWAAAWSSTIDPDMYQVYHKDSQATSTLNWGYKQIKMNIGDQYAVEVELLDLLAEQIEAGRETNDQIERARCYKIALDIVMELAIELPTYQRDDLFAYNINKIDKNSLTPEKELSPYNGLMSDIHKVKLHLTK